MIKITFHKDYSKDYNVKFYGIINLCILYENGKVVEIKKKKGNINYLQAIEKFKEENRIQTDDVITIVDMYFANKFSKEYIGKGIFE